MQLYQMQKPICYYLQELDIYDIKLEELVQESRLVDEFVNESDDDLLMRKKKLMRLCILCLVKKLIVIVRYS